jgi:hypothetical protein
VPLHPASHAEIARLIEELAADDVLRRETAAARLALTGRKAASALARLIEDATAPATARLAALEVLETTDPARAAGAALAVVDAAHDELAIAAIASLARAVHDSGAAAAAALDRLTALALDVGADATRRIAALSALEPLPPRVVDPIYQALRSDPASRVVARVVRRQSGEHASLDEMVDQGLPSSAAVLAAVVRDEAAEARVTVLRKLIDLIRAREQQARGDAGDWMAVRGQVHQHLAARGSRLALYDLRETLETSTGPLPVGFLAAAAAVGDATCLHAIASAWIAAPASEAWWRDHLAAAFAAIVRRERIRAKDPRLRRLIERLPGASALLAR